MEDLLGAQIDATEVWKNAASKQWPRFFQLLDIGVALESLRYNEAVCGLNFADWPRLREILEDAEAVSRLRESPVIVPGSRAATCHSSPAAAREEWATRKCTHVDFFLNEDQRCELGRLLDNEIRQHQAQGLREDLIRAKYPQLFQQIEQAISADCLRAVIGDAVKIAHCELTLGIQNLRAGGVGWHRDQYWPNHDRAITVIYSLLDDTPDKGGAFLYYVDRENQLYHFHRRRHQATLLDNDQPRSRRLFHAVSGYMSSDTRRHTLIIQCVPG